LAVQSGTNEKIALFLSNRRSTVSELRKYCLEITQPISHYHEHSHHRHDMCNGSSTRPSYGGAVAILHPVSASNENILSSRSQMTLRVRSEAGRGAVATIDEFESGNAGVERKLIIQ